MAISLASAAQRIRDRITERSESAAGYSIASIKGLLPGLSEQFARMIVDDPNLAQHLRPAVSFTNTVVAGVADLSTNIASPNLLLLDKIEQGEIRLSPDTLGLPFHWVQESAQLSWQRLGDSMFVSCVVEGSNLYTRNVDGSLTSLNNAISISAPFIPVIAATAAASTLPFALEGALIEFGAQRALHVLQPKMPRVRRAA